MDNKSCLELSIITDAFNSDTLESFSNQFIEPLSLSLSFCLRKNLSWVFCCRILTWRELYCHSIGKIWVNCLLVHIHAEYTMSMYQVVRPRVCWEGFTPAIYLLLLHIWKNEKELHILLECILVYQLFFFIKRRKWFSKEINVELRQYKPLSRNSQSYKEMIS